MSYFLLNSTSMGCLLLMIIVKMFLKGGKMDQVKIGKFISEARRKKNITNNTILKIKTKYLLKN